ncbi:MAG: hypothetical protein AAFU61_15420 [Pseudomonadota bacterium]
MGATPFDGLADVFTQTLGQTVALIDRAGVEFSARGVFVEGDGEALDMITARPTLALRSVDADRLDAGFASLSRATIGGRSFRIYELSRDGRGMTTAELEAVDA